MQAGAGLRAAGRAWVRAGGAPPPRGQSRPRESKGAVGDAPGLTRRRRVGLVVELAACRVPQVERVDEGDMRTAGLRFDCWAVICSV